MIFTTLIHHLITINGVTVDSHKSGSVPYNTNVEYKVNAGGKNFTLIFMKSTAESAVYINNDNADGNGTELITYLNRDKSNSASATAAIIEQTAQLKLPILENKGKRKLNGARLKNLTTLLSRIM